MKTFMWILSLLAVMTVSNSFARLEDDDLTQKFAQERKAQVKSVNYELHFQFKKGSDTYEGRTLMELELHDVKRPLSIDSHEHDVRLIMVNGNPLKTFKRLRGSLEIPAKALTPKNVIEIVYRGKFSKASSGLQRSVDPEDGSEYIFTDFEPYYAHWLFPCLDQPDLKATYQVNVEAPKDWKVISNDLIQETKEEGDIAKTKFMRSRPFSTYLFFLGAGPFVEWTDEVDDIPLTLYARKTLAKYVDHEKIMETTKKGMRFFNKYFGYPYPFPKYGQVFIPEFSWGGMENPGAVALNERNIFRGPVTETRYEDRDNLILHEMAHMWFGDLVTMEWWNDLWLNESFATYLASVAQDRALGAKGTWPDFFSTKTWGLWQDQLVTTHPIETPVPDVRTARGNFDGITYAKGASALKQLHFRVGEKGFREGLVQYFKKFAFKNSTRADFIGSIAEASGTNLDVWTQDWLQSAGPHKVKVSWSCEKDKLSSLSVIQEPNATGVLSVHKTKIGFYKVSGQEVTLLGDQDVVYEDSPAKVIDLKKMDCPNFVFPNLGDHDYALFSLDEVSLKNSQSILTGSSDPLLRLMQWNILEQMMRDALLPRTAFFDLALMGLEKEADEMVLGILLGRHSTLRTHYFTYLTPKEREALAPRLENLLWNKFDSSKEQSGLQLTYLDFVTSIAQTKESLNRLRDMLKSEGRLDQDRRWSVIGTLVLQGHPQGKGLLAEEEKRDPSTQGKRLAYAIKVGSPESKEKNAFWKTLKGKHELPYTTVELAAYNFHHHNHQNLSLPFLKDYFKTLEETNWKVKDSLVEVYFTALFPRFLCSEDLLRRSEKSLKRARGLTSLARRNWLEANDELARCVRARK